MFFLRVCWILHLDLNVKPPGCRNDGFHRKKSKRNKNNKKLNVGKAWLSPPAFNSLNAVVLNVR